MKLWKNKKFNHKIWSIVNAIDKKFYILGGFIVVVAGFLIWKAGLPMDTNSSEVATSTRRQLPDSFDLQTRNSLKYPKDDIKYRLVARSYITQDTPNSWKTYHSREYGFSFSFPPDLAANSTENLGFQLPKDQAGSGNRDNFEITLATKQNAYFVLYMNNPKFSIPTGTLESMAKIVQNNLTMEKRIINTSDSKPENGLAIVFNFDKNNNHYTWYGTMDEKELESINTFESIVATFKFEK